MKRLKYIALGYVAFLAVIALLSFVAVFSGGAQGLADAASDKDTLAELVELQRMGCPADVVMMLLSYLRDKHPDQEHTAISLGLHFLQLRVAVEVLDCSCAASSPLPPSVPGQPPPTAPSCTCDYEFDRVEEYNTPGEILTYLSILGEAQTPLAAANLQERGNTAAQAHCNRSGADDRASAVFQPTPYTDGAYRAAIQQCGVTIAKDVEAILTLHREGAFIEYLTLESKRQGFAGEDYIGQYPVPARGNITCPFGWRIHPITNKPDRHNGIDIATQWHTPINVIADGEVVGRGTDKYDGRYILVRHDAGAHFYSYYGHLSQWSVSVGDPVKAGDEIGLEGGDSTDPEPGYSTGHHLHFEIRMSRDGGQVNPLSFLKRTEEEGE